MHKRAIILAAGRGRRMGAETANKPKCLMQLHGKPLIEHQLHVLNQTRQHQVAIVTGYREEMLQQYGSHRFHNPRWETTNMVASLLCSKNWLEQGGIVSYSDIVYHPSIVQQLARSKEDIAVAYDPHWLSLWKKRFDNPLDDAESFQIGDNEMLLDIGRKIDRMENIEGQYMGLISLSKKGFAILQNALSHLSTLDKNNLDMTGLLQLLLQKNVPIKGVANTHPWCEIDCSRDLHIAEKWIDYSFQKMENSKDHEL